MAHVTDWPDAIVFIAFVCLIIAFFGALSIGAWNTPVKAEMPSVIELRIDRLELEEERRHREILIKIESLRRQMLQLHGKRWLEL